MKYYVLSLFVVAALAAPTPDNGDVELIVHGVPEGQPLEIGDILDIKLKEGEDSHTDLLHPLTAVGIAEAAAAAEAAAQIVAEAAVEQVVLGTPVNFVDNEEQVAVAEPALVDFPTVDVQPIAMPVPVEPEVSGVEEIVVVHSPVEVQPIVLPGPIEPEVSVDVQPIVMPAPVEPEVSVDVQPIVMPAPVEPEVSVDVQPIVMPAPVEPEVSVDVPVITEPEITEILPEPAAQSPSGEVFNNGVVQVHVNAPEDPGVFATLQSWFSLAVNYISNGIQSTQQIV